MAGDTAIPLRVLLVEDRAADAELILRELRRAGYEPEWSRVQTEQGFLTQLDCGWQLILADFSLPQFTGLRALALLKARGLDIPFILVSGTIGEERAVAAMKAGVHDYLMKDRLQRLGPAIERELREASERGERRRATEELRASERRYALLAEAAHDLISVVNHDGVIEYVNTFAARQIGIPASAVVGRKLSDVFPAEVALRRQESVAHALETRQPQYVEASSIFQERKVWLSSWIVPINEDGVPPTKVLIVSRDITETRRVAESHELLATAVEHAGEAIVITALDATIRYVNPAFERSSGYSSAESVGRNPRFLNSGRHDAEFYRQLWATLTSGQMWRGHMTNRRKDGSLYEEDLTISPVRDASGAVTNYVAVKRDVTQAMALQAQFYQAQKMESIGRLAGGIAHDFNNLLTVINGTAEILLEGAQETDPLQADLTQIRLAGDRAAALTRQLLAFSRRQVIQRRLLSLAAVVTDTEPMLRRLIGEDVELEVTSVATADSVRADVGQLEQVLVNLVVNARDAMPQGGRLAITVSNVELDRRFSQVHGYDVRPGPYAVLEVTDTGTGMDEATQRQIFEPFFTTKGPGQGTGLGLSTVYGIVKQNDGYVEVSSQLGRGTTFSVYLPRISGPADPLPAKPAAVVGGTETILLVEDEQELRNLGKRVLAHAGYTVLTAASGSAALDVLARHDGPVHLLITDIVMPGMSGPALAQQCQGLRPGLRMLYMSGYTTDVIVRHGVEDGMPFLHKPFTAAELKRNVREAIDAPASAVARHEGR